MGGIDISGYQAGIALTKVTGVDFVIIREGYGTSIDGSFLQHLASARKARIPVPGVYHWIDGRSVADAKKNAQTAIQNVRTAGLPATTVIWCDLEFTPDQQKARGLSYADMKAMSCAFCDTVLAAGYPTGIYTNQAGIWQIYGKGILDKYDIWLADLEGEAGFPCVYRQTGYRRVTGWPYDVDADEFYGQYTAGTAKPQEEKQMCRIVYTEKELTDILVKLGKGNPPSSYDNHWPKNLLYWDGKRWWADCVNLYKALFNGRKIDNPEKDSFQKDLSNTGDVTGWGLLKQCSDKSQDFTKLGNHFRCLYLEDGNDWHFGGYLGFEWDEPGQGIVNVVESTPRWDDGIQYSYVDQYGNRSWAKGLKAEGVWTWHGLATPWIQYNFMPEPEPAPEKLSTEDLAVHIIRGDFGVEPERTQKLQALGYTDAEIKAAQKLVDQIVDRYNLDVLACDIAMAFISGEAGDGVANRKKWLRENYPEKDVETLYELAKNKVNDYLGV